MHRKEPAIAVRSLLEMSACELAIVSAMSSEKSSRSSCSESGELEAVFAIHVDKARDIITNKENISCDIILSYFLWTHARNMKYEVSTSRRTYFNKIFFEENNH